MCSHVFLSGHTNLTEGKEVFEPIKGKVDKEFRVHKTLRKEYKRACHEDNKT